MTNTWYKLLCSPHYSLTASQILTHLIPTFYEGGVETEPRARSWDWWLDWSSCSDQVNPSFRGGGFGESGGFQKVPEILMRRWGWELVITQASEPPGGPMKPQIDGFHPRGSDWVAPGWCWYHWSRNFTWRTTDLGHLGHWLPVRCFSNYTLLPPLFWSENSLVVVASRTKSTLQSSVILV